MGHYSSIVITFNEKKVSLVRLIEDMVNESSWELNDNGKISFLPLNDIDNSDWQRIPLQNQSMINDLIKNKSKQQEIIGLVFTWEGTQIGGEFLFRGNSINFTPSINRKKLNNDSDFTDISWYLERLLTIFPSSDCVVENITISENV